MEKPKLPVKVRLGKLSENYNDYAVYFQIYDEFWVIQSVSALGRRVVLGRSTRFQVALILAKEDKLIDYTPGKFGVSCFGYLSPIKKTFSRAAICRYARQDGKLIFWRSSGARGVVRLRIVTNESGYLFASNGVDMRLIEFSTANKIPIKLSRTQFTHDAKRFQRIPSKRFLFNAEGLLLRPLEPVIEIVMKNSLRFVDPTEFVIGRGGIQQLVFTLGNVYDS